MKSKMRKKLIAFMLCMVLVICNSVSILADTPAAETTTAEKQVKETKSTKDESASEEDKTTESKEDTSKQSDKETAPETKTTEKKEETTEATTEKKEESTTEATTKAKEETTTADKTDNKEETTTAEEGKETSEASDKKTKEEEKSTETKDEENAVTELTYENDDVIVTVSEVAEGAIPEGAELKVVPILKDDTETQAQYEEVEQKIQEKAAETETEIKGFLAYDITFVDEDGNEIEPNSEVKVSMEYRKAAIPAELSEEDAKNAEVSVMHLEEDADGNVSQVVDMGEAGKIDTLETTDAKQVEKVEVKTESFSVFTITWEYGDRWWNNFNIEVHYGYFGENNEWHEWDKNTADCPEELKELPEINLSENNNQSNPLDLTQYQVQIDGYSYTETRVDNYINGDKVKSLITNNYYYSVNYIDDKNESHNWLNNYNKKEGNIYFIYEEAGLKIEDNIIEEGTLNAVLSGIPEADLEGITYIWSKCDTKNGTYEEVEKINYQGGASNLSEDGSMLYPAYDEGARQWYQVKAVLADGREFESAPYQVPYFDELQNGSFETPVVTGSSSNRQYTNEEYADAGGVWQSTGINSNKNNVAIEIVHEGREGGDRENSGYSWYSNWNDAAPEGEQFAELNCEAAGALYQDVLTM